MVRTTVQVLEDENTNLVHLVNGFNSSQPSDVHAFVQTGNGVQTLSSGQQHIRGNLRHKYTGSFNGDKETYARNLLYYGKEGLSNEAILRKSGVKNLKKGKGVIVSAFRLLKMGARGYSVSQVWDDCIADGVVTAEEFALLGLAIGGVRLPNSIFNGDEPDPCVEPQLGTDLETPIGLVEPEAESVWSMLGDAFGSAFDFF